MRRSIFPSLLVFLLLCSPELRAQFQCESAGGQGWQQLNSPNSPHEYRIIVENVLPTTLQYTISQAAFIQSVIQAADAWNDQAHGGTLLYRGTQQAFPAHSENLNGVADPWGIGGDFILPFSEAACDSLGLTESIVRVTGAPVGVPGDLNSRCGGTRFELKIYYREALGAFDRRLYISEYPQDPNPPGGDLDLIGLLTHEFGHALGLGHTTGGGESVMSPADDDNNNTATSRRRELYTWDTDCVSELFGERSLVGTRRYYRSPISDITFVPSEITKTASGPSYSSGSFRRIASFKHQSCWGWQNIFTAGFTCATGIPATVPATTPAIYNDFNQAIDRVHFASREGYTAGWLQESSYAYSSVRRLKYTRSTNGFASTLGNGGVNVCSSMSAWMTCAGQAHAFSNHPPAIAWDPARAVSVTAWTNHNRLTNNEEREVRISAGVISDTVLPQPWYSGRHSDIAPAVACKPGSGYNCLLAYVDPGDSLNRLRIQRFRNATGCGYRYCYDAESGYSELAIYPQMVQTSSRVALWYDQNDGLFRAAVRANVIGQPLRVYTSPTGTTWTLEHSGVSAATGVAGPSTYTGGGSFLTYAN
jgi:hypothetical protein